MTCHWPVTTGTNQSSTTWLPATTQHQTDQQPKAADKCHEGSQKEAYCIKHQTLNQLQAWQLEGVGLDCVG